MAHGVEIAAVTALLRTVIASHVQPASVSTYPPDRANAQPAGQRLNLFLYHLAPNAAWRNQPLPDRSKPKEGGPTPLALDLYYLLTAFGDDEDEADHQLLGRAMSLLHGRPYLPAATIQQLGALTPTLREANLHERVDAIRIRHEPLSLEESSKLWASFQTQYRVSTAYQVSVVLLEPDVQPAPALPVARRGFGKDGPLVITGVVPEIEAIDFRYVNAPRPALPAAVLDATGQGPGCIARFRINGATPAGSAVVVFDPNNGGPSRPSLRLPVAPEDGAIASTKGAAVNGTWVQATLPAEDASWASGQMKARLEVNMDGRLVYSSPFPFPVAPNLQTNGNLLSYVTFVENGARKLLLHLAPPPGPHRQTLLLLSGLDGARGVSPRSADESSPNYAASTPVFNVQDVPPGRYFVRVRVDMVDSVLLRLKPDGVVEIDQRQVVVL
jgi:hypothetical protein